MITAFFVATVLATFSAILLLTRRAAPVLVGRTAAGLLVLLAATAGLAASGVLSNFDRLPPPFLILLLTTSIATFRLSRSRFGAALAGGPLAWLIGIHVFRIPVEIFLHWGAQMGFVPPQMTWEGRNWDILTGISAVPMAWLASRGKLPRATVLTWNALGFLLLLNVVTVAILSMPTPIRQFHNEPAATFAATWPYVWLPAFLVQAAWFGHLLIWRGRPASDE